MEALIFLKFDTSVHEIVLDHQPNFHKDPCKDARARGENARTCEALHFWIDTKKSYFIHFFKPGQNIMSLLKRNIQPIDTPNFFFRVLKFFRGIKMGVPQKIMSLAKRNI